MVENLGRKFTLIFSLLGLAVLALSIGGFRLGLDLQGGTRLVYSIDFDKAAQEGLITELELQDKGALFNQMRTIWEERLDPTGLRNPTIRREGENRIVIEVPGSAARLRKTCADSLRRCVTVGQFRFGCLYPSCEAAGSFAPVAHYFAP